MIVKPSQVEAALEFKDGDHLAEIFFRSEMARIEYEEALAQAKESFGGATVSSRENQALLVPRVKELARAWALARTEWHRLKTKMEKADTIIELYRTESANSRKGVL